MAGIADRRAGRGLELGGRVRLPLVALLVSSLAWADDAPRLWAIDGGVCLSDAALVASERDRQATKLELSEARQQKSAVLVGVSVGALVLGAVVGFVARGYVSPPSHP